MWYLTVQIIENVYFHFKFLKMRKPLCSAMYFFLGTVESCFPLHEFSSNKPYHPH